MVCTVDELMMDTHVFVITMCEAIFSFLHTGKHDHQRPFVAKAKVVSSRSKCAE